MTLKAPLFEIAGLKPKVCPDCASKDGLIRSLRAQLTKAAERARKLLVRNHALRVQTFTMRQRITTDKAYRYEKKREYGATYYARLKAAGLCYICRKAPVEPDSPSTVLCVSCHGKEIERQKVMREKKRHPCVRCKRNLTGWKYCRPCQYEVRSSRAVAARQTKPEGADA